MNDTEKIDHLRKLLAGPLAVYYKCLERELLDPEDDDWIDDSYIYDCAEDWFMNESRGIYASILHTLAT